MRIGVKHFFVTFFITGILAVFSYFSAQAAVVQSAKDALSNDIFVFGPSRTHQSTKVKRNRTNTKAKKAEPRSVSSSQDENEQKTKDTPQPQETPSQEEEDDVQETLKNPNAGYGYTKKYASKLFKTYSGYITIEQKNIPSRIGVTKGSTIQFNLKETPDAIWYVELDEKIGKIISNKVNGNQRILIIQAINAGNTRLFLDNISIKDKKYKVIFSKKMSLLVDE